MVNRMQSLSLKVKIIGLLSVIGLLLTAFLSINLYRDRVGHVYDSAENTTADLISRSVEMFMVSTRRFHEDFQRTANQPEERKRILDDWNRTIFAVDEAVIHDHGPGKPRVRLIGDETLFGYRPLGAAASIGIQIPFETAAAQALMKGEPQYRKIEDGYMRTAVPLWSHAHPGCAECHFSVVENDQVDMTRKILLGSLNAYIPLNQALTEARTATWQAIGFLVVAILVLMGGVYWIMERMVVRPVVRIAGYLATGAEQVASAARQVSSSSQVLAEGASEQAASIEESSSSLEEMAAMTKQNANNSRQANDLMNDTKAVVVQANTSMEELNHSMLEITRASEETSKIVKTIDEIAFQTNLLALNAAVEAARAGEAGAGFAVVADEVRNLALRASEAAKNTAGLIDGTVKKVHDGSQLMSSTHEAFTQVAARTAKVADLVNEISAASSEQAQGIEHINIAVTEMDKVVQQNAATAEESASASQEMTGQTTRMTQWVQELLTVIGTDKRQLASNFQLTSGSASSQQQIASGKRPPVRLGHAAVRHSAKSKEVRPEQLIPFDDDELKHF